MIAAGSRSHKPTPILKLTALDTTPSPMARIRKALNLASGLNGGLCGPVDGGCLDVDQHLLRTLGDVRNLLPDQYRLFIRLFGNNRLHGLPPVQFISFSDEIFQW